MQNETFSCVCVVVCASVLKSSTPCFTHFPSTQAYGVPRETLRWWSCMTSIFFIAPWYVFWLILPCVQTTGMAAGDIRLNPPAIHSIERMEFPHLTFSSPNSYCRGVVHSLKSQIDGIDPSWDGNEWVPKCWAIHPADCAVRPVVAGGGAAQEGLSVCITSHLLGHNVETEPLHYLDLHGCPPSCARAAPQPSGTGRKIVLYNLQWSMWWSKPGPFTACRDDLYTVCTQWAGGSTEGCLRMHAHPLMSSSAPSHPLTSLFSPKLLLPVYSPSSWAFLYWFGG